MIEQYKNTYDELIISQKESVILDIFDAGSGKRTVKLAEDQSCKYLALLSGTCELELEILCASPKAQIICHVLSLAAEHEKITLRAKVILQASHTQADMHLLTFLTSGGRSEVDGSVVIVPGVVKVSGHLLEENIILGEDVQLKTLPMLDVRSNDVSASHGARIEKLDAKKLFYLESKGIAPVESKRLMVEGYVEDMLSILDDAEIIVQKKAEIMTKI